VRIEASGVQKRYGRVTALDGVSFELPPRSRVALVGPNGSGKSTLNRILMGLVGCQGSVRLDGRCPFRERVALARRLAYVPQIAPPGGARVRSCARSRACAGSLATRRAVAGELELDLARIVARPFRSLSGGTKQKLLIALALSSEASLLILDEPTGSLDARSRERFFALFDALATDVTLVLCSHRLDEIRLLVDHVLRLEDGRIAFDGPAAALLDRYALAAIDVWADGDPAAAWLLARGFRRTPASVWHRTLRTRADAGRNFARAGRARSLRRATEDRSQKRAGRGGRLRRARACPRRGRRRRVRAVPRRVRWRPAARRQPAADRWDREPCATAAC
jgi:ABC-2 type transport system ATP-binding protein